MTLDSKERKLAKHLALLVVQKGEGAVGEIKPALEKIIAGRPASEKKKFLRHFSKIVAREFQKDTLTIESAVALEDNVLDSLEQVFAGKHPRRIYRVQRENPDLIGGIRVRLGDTVYDASVQGKLNHLKSTIH